jgi:hypothetical protein
MKPSTALPEAAGLRAPCTRRRPRAAARCCVVAVAGLLAAVVPGRAGAADLALAIADQVQQAAWSQASAPTVDVNTTVTQVTHAALSSADPVATAAVVHERVAAVAAGVTPAPIMADGAEVGVKPGATGRAPPQEVRRARVHKKARSRHAAAAASPLPVPPQASEVESREPTEPPVSTRDRTSEKRAAAPGTTRESPKPSVPFRPPPLPFPFAMPSSVGVGSAAGSLVPPLLVALAAALALFLPEVLIRRVPSRRPARPSRIVLPPWRPG